MKSMFMRYAVSFVVIAVLYLGSLYMGCTPSGALMPVGFAAIAVATWYQPLHKGVLVGILLFVVMFFAALVEMIAIIGSGVPHKLVFSSLAIAATAFGFTAVWLSGHAAKGFELDPGEVIVPSFIHGGLVYGLLMFGPLLLS